MNYESIDPVLSRWAVSRSVPLLTQYKDEEVRAFEIIGKKSKRQFQIWIDLPDAHGRTMVHAWDRKKWRIDYETTAFALTEALDTLLKEIECHDQGR